MVHADERFVGSPCGTLRERYAHDQRAQQAGSVGHAHGVEVVPGQLRHAEHLGGSLEALVAHAADRFDMLAAGDLGHHAAKA